MKSTPLKVQGNLDAYTRFRTSKVMYMNEAVYSVAHAISRNVDLAMKFNVSEAKHGSENYQVMNYGMGGSIISHLDSLGETSSLNNQEHYNYGGPRFTTFMLYLSDVEAGGHTVFSTLGLYVKPRLGDALFWFNLDSAGDYDTRNIHLGCPVLHGNKWIANKWVHWLDQMWNYPCYRQKNTPFSLHHFIKP